MAVNTMRTTLDTTAIGAALAIMSSFSHNGRLVTKAAAMQSATQKETHYQGHVQVKGS